MKIQLNNTFKLGYIMGLAQRIGVTVQELVLIKPDLDKPEEVSQAITEVILLVNKHAGSEIIDENGVMLEGCNEN